MSSFQFNDSEDFASKRLSIQSSKLSQAHEKYIRRLETKSLKENTLQDKGLKRLITRRKQIQELDTDEKNYVALIDKLRFGIPTSYIRNHDELTKDEIFHILMDPKKCKHHHEPCHHHHHDSSSSILDSSRSDSSQSLDGEPVENIEMKSVNRFVIYPDSTFYNIWIVIKTIFCCTTAFLYPYCTAFGGISYDFKDPLWV